MRARLLAVALATLPLAAQAAQVPRLGLVDPHIQSVDYDPDQLVLLKGQLGYQIMIEFGPGERLESVSIGDSLGWQVTPNRNANVLFLKPLERNAATNMNVVTNQRRYAFELGVLPKGARTTTAPYILRFVYPQVAVALEAAPPSELPPEERNRAYTITGSAENAPARVFDDGRMTYFAWAPLASAPAIFAVGTDGKENLVNYGVRGDYTVVQQLAPRFVLRSGKAVTIVINTAFGAAGALQAANP